MKEFFTTKYEVAVMCRVRIGCATVHVCMAAGAGLFDVVNEHGLCFHCM